MRWLVERSRDVFEDVGADAMCVLPCGALEFTGDEGIYYLLAPGQWITVCEAAE